MKIENKKLISVEESDLVDGVFSNTEITEIGDFCFYMMGKLIKVYCPNVTKMGDWNFYNNHALTTIGDFPLLAEQGDWNFSANPALTTIGDFPLLAKQWSCNFYYNPALTTIGDFPLLAKQGNYNFSHNPALTKLSIGGESLNVKSVDGSCFVIESTTTKLGINIYTGYNLLSITNGIIKKEHCFVAEKDGFFAHGETVKKAIQDVQFKAIAEKLKNEPIKADTVISVQYYRTVTGACEMGCKSWMNQNGISVEEMTAAELLPLLKKTSAYGYEKIKSLITF